LYKVIHQSNPIVPNPSPGPTLRNSFSKSEFLGVKTSKWVECPEMRATKKANAQLWDYPGAGVGTAGFD